MRRGVYTSLGLLLALTLLSLFTEFSGLERWRSFGRLSSDDNRQFESHLFHQQETSPQPLFSNEKSLTPPENPLVLNELNERLQVLEHISHEPILPESETKIVEFHPKQTQFISNQKGPNSFSEKSRLRYALSVHRYKSIGFGNVEVMKLTAPAFLMSTPVVAEEYMQIERSGQRSTAISFLREGSLVLKVGTAAAPDGSTWMQVGADKYLPVVLSSVQTPYAQVIDTLAAPQCFNTIAWEPFESCALSDRECQEKNQIRRGLQEIIDDFHLISYRKSNDREENSLETTVTSIVKRGKVGEGNFQRFPRIAASQDELDLVKLIDSVFQQT